MIRAIQVGKDLYIRVEDFKQMEEGYRIQVDVTTDEIPLFRKQLQFKSEQENELVFVAGGDYLELTMEKTSDNMYEIECIKNKSLERFNEVWKQQKMKNWS